MLKSPRAEMRSKFHLPLHVASARRRASTHMETLKVRRDCLLGEAINEICRRKSAADGQQYRGGDALSFVVVMKSASAPLSSTGAVLSAC